MNGKWKLTTEQKKELIDDYRSGQSYAQLSTKYKIQYSSIYYHINRINPSNAKNERITGKPECYTDRIRLKIQTMEDKLKDESISEERKMRIRDCINRYEEGIKNFNRYKNSAIMYVIPDYE